MARWRRELTEIGLELWEIDLAIRESHAARIACVFDHDVLDRLAARLLEPDGRLAAEKVFARRDVIVAAAPHLFGADPTMLDRLVDKVIAHPDAVELEPAGLAREQVWAPKCVVDTELAIEAKASSRHSLGTAAVISPAWVDLAIRATEISIGHQLTESQRQTIAGICNSSRSLDVVVGVAGSGKTTALQAVRMAHEQQGLRVLGAATSGQAARTIGRDAGIESFTVASLLARIASGSVQLNRRTAVVLDEAGMTDDGDLLRLINETTNAGSTLVLVGDDRQLSAVGPGGSLGALVQRFGGGIWQLTDNIRQIDISERQALAELRSGDVEVGVQWLARNDRMVTGGDRAEMIGAAVDGWLADVDRGMDTLMLAWKRASVDALNELGRHAFLERGWLVGPEIAAPGGKRYRGGDRVVTLAPFAGKVVTSETGSVEGVEVADGSLTVRFDDGRCRRLPQHATAADRLAYGYAITVHRSQGATVDTSHCLEDGGGRELAYVGLSRARHRSTVYVEADDVGQAIDDLTGAWSIERRQEWAIDRTEPVEQRSVRRDDLGVGLDL